MNLFALLKANAGKGSFRAEGNVIYVYDVLVSSEIEASWWGGVSAEAFARTLAGMSGDVALRINSPGGDVFAGRAMAAAIAAYPGTVTAHVDGYAASAASLITNAAGRVVMADGAMIMIHNAWTLTMGNAADHLAQANLLGKIDAGLAESYALRGSKDAAEFAALMTAETWFTADEAIKAGLADEKAAAAQPRTLAAWNLAAYQHAPAAPSLPALPSPNNDAARRQRMALARLRQRAA